MPPQRAQSRCVMCNEPDAKACSKCRSSRYCCRECQSNDWPDHKLLCRAYASLPPRPGPQHVLAFSFPTEFKDPELVWIEYENRRSAALGDHQAEKIDHLLASRKKTVKTIEFNPLRGPALDGYYLAIHFRDAFMMDGSRRNMSVFKATQSAAGHEWAGPVIVTRRAGSVLTLGDLQDVTMADFRVVVDWFLTYGTPAMDARMVARLPHDLEPPLKAVKVACKGDIRDFRLRQFSTVFFPLNHPVFAMPFDPDGDPPGIAELIELPIYVKKLPPNPVWAGRAAAGAYDSAEITFLYLNTDVNSREWGWAPLQWRAGKVGSVVVLRQDARDLLPEHVEVLCDFCLNRLQPLFESALDGERSKQDVMSRITRDAFEQYFERYRQKRVAEADRDPSLASWADVPSPYA